MDEREPSPSPAPPLEDGTSPAKKGTSSSSSSGVVGWVLLIALAIGVLALRFFGGGGC